MMRMLFVLIGLCFMTSCGDDIAEIDKMLIMEYRDAENLSGTFTDSGLFVVIDDAGSSEMPTISSIVDVCYEGYLTDGQIFDTTYSNGTCTEVRSFGLNQVIEGWSEGLQLFGREGKGKLVIPSNLAYGNNPPPGSIIPENAILVFDIHLVDFN